VRLIVGITGATGAPFGVRPLELLRDIADVETHLVLSSWARSTIELETPYTVREVARLADVSYGTGDQAAAISSGSFRTDGMVVAPCSMKTLAGIRTGYADNLLLRAADVVLKERRKLVVVARETPLSEIHLDNMLALARMGAVVLPPVPAFYNHAASVADHVAMRVLDQFGLDAATARAGKASRMPAGSVRTGLPPRCRTPPTWATETPGTDAFHAGASFRPPRPVARDRQRQI
jgi:4-hydroxy-3-polyprenylbenzoate decarboxylase